MGLFGVSPPVELKDQVSVSVLYVGGDSLPEILENCPGITGYWADSPDAAIVAEKRCNIVLMEPGTGEMAKDRAVQWLTVLNPERFRFRPGLFCIMGPEVSPEDRLDLLEAGFDEFLETPLSLRAFRLLTRRWTDRIGLAQQQYRDSVSLEKSFAYLDRFKSELAGVKQELSEEKNSLNAALKQLQKMTEERRRLKQTVSDLKDALQQNVEGFGQILGTLVQTRVEANRGHGEQVADIARFIGRGMGLTENQLEDLGKAAMLHEVGLLFLSEAALNGQGAEKKQSGISNYDRTLMVQYPVRGADLLGHCPGFESAARIIRSMNEWSDGTGYPDGLKRRYIPLGSRILAGADELETLRQNPDITGPEALLEGLEHLAGARLDPVIVGELGKYVVTRMTPESFKVRGVGLAQLEPGMILGTALFTATGTKLFSANTELTRESIEKIIQYSREYPVSEIVYIKV